MPTMPTSESVEALLHLFKHGFLIVRHAHAAPAPGQPDRERHLSGMGRVQCLKAFTGHLGIIMGELGLAYLASSVHRYTETAQGIFGNNVPTRVDVPEFYSEHPEIPRGEEQKALTDRVGYQPLTRYYQEANGRELLELYAQVALAAFVRESRGQPHDKIGVLMASAVYGPQLALDLARGFCVKEARAKAEAAIMGVNLPATGAILVNREGVMLLLPAE